jgi:shikimate kinase
MKSKKNLVLLGMMGSGKSIIGNLISKKLKLKFIDIDNVIEKEANMNITEIFSKKGENFFRNLEEKITIKSLESSNVVISLGGGGFVNEKIRKEVITNNFSFWLNWNNTTLFNRIKKSYKRPITFYLSNQELLELIEKRKKIYSKADFEINCNKLSKTEIVKKIMILYEGN